MERRDPERADPITRLVASRVRALRTERGMSGAALGAAVHALGLHSWVASTVGKLETMRREALTIREVIALAVALDVPLPWLLVDPEAGTGVPLAEGIERDPWAVMLWLVGKEPLTDPPGPTWGAASRVIGQACQVATLVERFGQVRTHREIVAALLPDGRDADRAAEDERQERRVLEDITRPMRALVRLGFSPPPLPEELVKRAVELDVELPARDGEVEPS